MEFLIAADDRTGALETAGTLAHDGAGVVPTLTNLGDLSNVGSRAVVVDLATRHVMSGMAATRAVGVDSVGADRYGHKIDSTLRGNWASELVARHAETGRPVLVVPSYPALGRTCVGGVVLVDEVPVHEGAAGHDVRTPVNNSRPADMLRAAGALDVVGCHDLTDLVDWLEVPGGIAVADAATDDDLAAIANRWVGVDGVLFAGTSAAIGSAGARLFNNKQRSERPAVRGPVLVVCGSAHPHAIEQVEQRRRTRRAGPARRVRARRRRRGERGAARPRSAGTGQSGFGRIRCGDRGRDGAGSVGDRRDPPARCDRRHRRRHRRCGARAGASRRGWVGGRRHAVGAATGPGPAVVRDARGRFRWPRRARRARCGAH